MPPWLIDVPLAAPVELVVVGVLAVAAVVLSVLLPARARQDDRLRDRRQRDRLLRRLLRAAIGAVAGAAVGVGLAWLLTQQLDLFDVTLSHASYEWAAGAFAGVGAAIPAVVRSPAARRIAGCVAIVLSLLAGALGINADFGQYLTVGSLVGARIAGPLPASISAAQGRGALGIGSTDPDAADPAPSADGPADALWRKWNAPADLPAAGIVSAVTIPATVSHFAARTAYVYLPPAALVPDPPRLPVLIMMSGQPGSPQSVVQSGDLAPIMNAYAAAHHGLAPIVVVPDQLQAPQDNPMCIDSRLGESATYLTVDVPDWIRTHLTVETQPAAWAIGGFSQGGTCAIQLGAAHPELFRGILDIAGQVAPADGSVAQIVERGFGGNVAAYRAALPESILAAHAPYADEVAVFGSGQSDTLYGPQADTMAAAARAAGIATTRVISPGTSHDWHTVQWVLTHGMTAIMQHLGLEQA